MNNNPTIPQISKFKISRRGRKLQVSDDARTLVALPKEVPERIWAEILQKEENDFIVFDIREEILEDALNICYERYMEKQNSLFTVHCAAMAWLKLIDWHFYRHDPGEEPSAYPPCHIPMRKESWTGDALPAPSPKDPWCHQDLPVLEECTIDEGLKRCPSSSSIDLPVIEDIPKEYWFPGKVKMANDDRVQLPLQKTSSYDRRPLVKKTGVSGVWTHHVNDSEVSLSDGLTADSELLQHVTNYSAENLTKKVTELSRRQSEDLAAESELLQRVTDYSSGEINKESLLGALKTTTPVDSSLQGGGDSTVAVRLRKKQEKSKSFSRASMNRSSRNHLQPLDKDSRISIISDCRLRNLRLDTQYEITSEKMDTPPGEPVKRK